jgi:hypothetical protein
LPAQANWVACAQRSGCGFHQAGKCFERLSAFAPNVKGRDQQPQDKGRDQESVCPADNDAIARGTTESDDGAVKQQQA